MRNELRIHQLIKKFQNIIPPDYERSHQALNRCQNSLLSSNKLSRNEIKFLSTLLPNEKLKTGMFEECFTDIDIIRTNTEEEQRFWSEFLATAEYRNLLNKKFMG